MAKITPQSLQKWTRKPSDAPYMSGGRIGINPRVRLGKSGLAGAPEEGGGGATDPNFANVSLLVNAENGLVDESSNGFTLTSAGNVAVSATQVKYGTQSVVFDGTGDYFDAPVNTAFDFGSGDFTVEMWVYYDTAPAVADAIWSKITGNPTSTGYVCYVLSSGQVRFDYYPNSSSSAGTNIASSTNLTINTWHHIACVRDGNDFELFIDGVSQGTFTSAITGSTGQTFRVGSWTDYTGRDWDGYQDDIRVTKGVARYTAAFTPPTEALPTS